MHGIEIREALPEDADKVLTFSRQAGAETDNLTFGAEGLPLDKEQEIAFLKDMREESRSVFYGVWKGSELIGTGTLHGMSRRMRHRASLAISIVKAEWNHGIGSRLMEQLIDYAKHHDIEMIQLEVRCDNERAIHLYEKYGFRRIGIFPAFFKIDEEYIDFELMYLDLR